MTRMVVDTDVYSFVLKNNQQAQRFAEPLRECQIVLSFQTVAELFKWTVVRNWQPPQITRLEAALNNCIIAPYDRDLAWVWARITGLCQQNGRSISSSDAWVAAVAIRYNIPLLTNNLRHYQPAKEYCGLQLFNISEGSTAP